MTQLEQRLNQMKKYYHEALKDPLSNRLYIEDLELSISVFEAQLKTSKPVLQQGWVE